MLPLKHSMYNLPDVKQLIEKKVNETTAEKWRHCAEHTIKEEGKLWELDHITDVVLDSLINNNADASDNTSSVIHINVIYHIIYTSSTLVIITASIFVSNEL